MTTSRSVSTCSLAFVCPPGDTAYILQIALPSSVMLKYLHSALERFATPQKAQFQRVQFCMHVAGMHVHRLAQVRITTKYYDVMQVDNQP